MQKLRILFVCLGNICRSPLAEGILRHQVRKLGWEAHFFIDSAGTSSFHEGELYHIESRRVAEERGVDLTGRSRPILPEDFDRFDYVVAMDRSNERNLKSLADGLHHSKIFRMMDFSLMNREIIDVPDPYYGGSEGFDQVFELLWEACQNFLVELKQRHPKLLA